MALRGQTCEACGGAFGCGAETGGCWCDEVTVDPAVLARLRGVYGRCLCPSCLKAAAGGALLSERAS